jgi:hypothetical protein
MTAAQARHRWSPATTVVAVCVASPLTASLFGSTSRRLPPKEHNDHDLLLSAVYLHYRRNHPHLAKLWVGEHVLPKAGYRIKDPDAFLFAPNGQAVRVIESAGRYGPDQIETFHEHCRERGLGYELW